MRQVTDHKLEGVWNGLQINAVDEPGPGGASHDYEIVDVSTDTGMHRIAFQNGPLLKAGLNGITNEVLLALVIDRLRGFQSGDFSCRENAIALTNLETALLWLHKRTRDRVARGVEGVYQK